ncbi:MAG: TolC family protein, partial [Bdellovibrionales bacterium]|nr:TolC family protein [Bdellovibrionales bacterium]
EAVKRKITVSLNTGSTYSNNPALAYLQQEVVIQEERKSLENAKLLTDFTIGYFNQSMIGYQTINGTEQYFGSGNRFSGFQIGIAIPLWFRPYTSKVQAAKVRSQIAESNYQQYQKSLKGSYQQAIQEYTKYKSSLDYYEESALAQSDLILKNAQQAFKNGTIGYVEYVQAIHQATQIQTNWLEVLNSYNQAIIQLEFLAGIK